MADTNSSIPTKNSPLEGWQMKSDGVDYPPSDWIETTLGEVCEKIGDGLHGTPKYSEDGEYFFINGNNIVNGKIEIKQDTKKIDQIEFDKYKKDLNERTVLLSINGTIGNLAKYRNEKCILGKSAAYFNIKNDVSVDFVYYLMFENRFQYDISKNANGSTIKNVGLAQLRNYSFLLPPFQEQKAIASVLSAFDDKIELLREQNKTLEEMGQTIFKEWFGKYGVDDELPEGWRVGKLSQIAEFLNGLALQKFPPENENEYLPVVKIRELKAGITTQTDRASKNIDQKYIVDDGDILFSWSGSLEIVIWKYGKGALNQHLFKVSSQKYPKWFYYFWTLYHLEDFRSIASNKATTMGHIQRHHLDQAQVIIPNGETLQELDQQISPILEKIMLINQEIQSLARSRDELLPKLMSGAVRVDFK